jgi:hypothetical protein
VCVCVCVGGGAGGGRGHSLKLCCTASISAPAQQAAALDEQHHVETAARTLKPEEAAAAARSGNLSAQDGRSRKGAGTINLADVHCAAAPLSAWPPHSVETPSGQQLRWSRVPVDAGTQVQTAELPGHRVQERPGCVQVHGQPADFS